MRRILPEALATSCRVMDSRCRRAALATRILTSDPMRASNRRQHSIHLKSGQKRQPGLDVLRENPLHKYASLIFSWTLELSLQQQPLPVRRGANSSQIDTFLVCALPRRTETLCASLRAVAYAKRQREEGEGDKGVFRMKGDQLDPGGENRHRTGTRQSWPDIFRILFRSLIWPLCTIA